MAGIQALRAGFSTLQSVPGGMAGISRHTFLLAKYAVTQLATLCHSNGSRVVRIYGDEDNYMRDNIEQQGGIVNFNLLDQQGDVIGFSALKTLCEMQNIILRYEYTKPMKY